MYGNGNLNKNSQFGGTNTMKKQTIKRTVNEIANLSRQFDRYYGINNWCLYNQEDQPKTSLIVGGEEGFYCTAWSLNDDEIREIHKQRGISAEKATDIICSSMFAT